MLVVSDTSPLNYLLLIGHEAVLPSLFGRVFTTPGVLRELRHPGSPDPVRDWSGAPPPWLEVRSPAALEPSLRLGRGETEAISLALELQADIVLIDERKGMQAATALGLVVTGTLAVLELASERQLLHLPSAIAALRQTTFRASERLYEEMLRRAAERERRGGHS